MKILSSFTKEMTYRPGNGIARRYHNARVANTAGHTNVAGWGAMSLLQAANVIANKSAFSGFSSVLSVYLTKQALNLTKSSKEVMKKLAPEYNKIVERTERIKKAANKAS